MVKIFFYNCKNLQFMKKYQNTFIAMLNLLKVKHTTVFSNNFFNEHPHKFNLYGLSMMLSDYRVRNAATRIKNIEVELQKHESWQEKTQLRATPTILVNGYKLP